MDLTRKNKCNITFISPNGEGLQTVPCSLNKATDFMLIVQESQSYNPQFNAEQKYTLFVSDEISDGAFKELKTLAGHWGWMVKKDTELDWDSVKAGRLTSETRMDELLIDKSAETREAYLEAIAFFKAGKDILDGLVKDGKMVKKTIGFGLNGGFIKEPPKKD